MAERLAFDRSLYLPEAVEAAVAAYAEHARIALTVEPQAVVAEITDPGEYDARTIALAFCNHVLFETITRRRQAVLDGEA